MTTSKVLLHLGLPKTATSSLQHNVFQRLHRNAKVNFLGKCLNYDYKTRNIEVQNYSGKFIRDAAEGAICTQDARRMLANVLDSSALNIFSDEGLMVAYPGEKNLSLASKFERLHEIFEDCDVSLVVTLREPTEYLYSLYVQLYPDFYANYGDLDSIEKYVDKVVGEPNNILFESLFYDRWLKLLPSDFDLTILRYEQAFQEGSPFYKSWAGLLGVPELDFHRCFNSKIVNAKVKSGKEVAKIRSFKSIERYFRELMAPSKGLFSVARFLYGSSGLKAVFNYRFESKTTHAFPSGERMRRLVQVLISVENPYEV